MSSITLTVIHWFFCLKLLIVLIVAFIFGFLLNHSKMLSLYWRTVLFLKSEWHFLKLFQALSKYLTKILVLSIIFKQAFFDWSSGDILNNRPQKSICWLYILFFAKPKVAPTNLPAGSVTRLGNLLRFGQHLKACRNF